MPVKRFEKNAGLKKEQGFTLIEVLFAMVVFAVGLLAIGALQITAIKGNSEARGNTEAATIAMDYVETLVGREYDDLVSPVDEAGVYPAVAGIYTITWAVTEDEVYDKTKTLAVTVSWNEEGQARQLTITRVVPEIV